MKSAKNFINNHYKIIGFFLGLIIIFIDLLICNITVTFGDSNGYCVMADYLKTEGVFNFNIQPPAGSTEAYLFSIRGYAWPLIIALCKIFGFETQIGFWFFYATFLALGISYALPEFIETLFQKKINYYIRILPVILTIYFWNGLIKYPLSDIPAVVTVSLGLMFLAKISTKKIYLLNIVYAILCGVMLGISYYIRSGCKPIIIIAIIIVLIYKYNNQYMKKIILVFIICISLCTTMIPQIMINNSCSNIISYEVPIFLNSNVTANSYYHGFQWLRYETNLSGIHPEVTMISYDHVLDNILATENIAIEDISLTILLKLFIKYPLEFLGLYATKFANCLDPRYGNDIYIYDLNSRQYSIMIFNYLLWFLTFLGITLQINLKTQNKGFSQIRNVSLFMKKYGLYIIAFIFPAIVHLAGTHIEARYFYPCYVLMYIFLGALCPWKQLINTLKIKCITISIICFAIFGCLNSIWNFTFENFKYSQLLLDSDYTACQIEKEMLMLEDTGTQNISYDIWSLQVNNDTYLTMSGYICALEKDSNNSDLTLVLLGLDTSYMFDVNLTDNIYMDNIYKKSKYSIGEELVGLNNGKYEIGFILRNNLDKSVVFTNKYIEIIK